jgi:hypothetical protein
VQRELMIVSKVAEEVPLWDGERVVQRCVEAVCYGCGEPVIACAFAGVVEWAGWTSNPIRWKLHQHISFLPTRFLDDILGSMALLPMVLEYARSRTAVLWFRHCRCVLLKCERFARFIHRR